MGDHSLGRQDSVLGGLQPSSCFGSPAQLAVRSSGRVGDEAAPDVGFRLLQCPPSPLDWSLAKAGANRPRRERPAGFLICQAMAGLGSQYSVVRSGALLSAGLVARRTCYRRLQAVRGRNVGYRGLLAEVGSAGVA